MTFSDHIERLRITLRVRGCAECPEIPDFDGAIVATSDELKTRVGDSDAANSVTVRLPDCLNHLVCRVVEDGNGAVFVASADKRA